MRDPPAAHAPQRPLISLKGSGLSRPNFNLDGADLRHSCGLRDFEVKLQRLLQISQGLVFALALAGNIQLQALRDVPIPFTPNGCGERSLHNYILSQAAGR